jgi:hypothetical protein
VTKVNNRAKLARQGRIARNANGSWIERGSLFVQQFDGAEPFNLGPVEQSVKGTSSKVRFGESSKSRAQLDREIADRDASTVVLGKVAVAQVANRPRSPAPGLRRLVLAIIPVDDDVTGSEAEDVTDTLSHGRQQALATPADIGGVSGLPLVGYLVGPSTSVAHDVALPPKGAVLLAEEDAPHGVASPGSGS